MREERLMERIHNLEDPSTRSGMPDQAVAIRSLVVYLNRILNTRKGAVLMDPEFGVPDFSSMASRFSTEAPETLDEIVEGIVRVVDKYEPRLSSPRVRFLEKKEFEITLFLELEADFRTQEGDIPLVLKINVTPEGRMQVTS